MINQFVIVLALGLMQPSCTNPNKEGKADLDNCKCKNNTAPIISFKDKSNNRLIFCGRINKKLSETKFVISEFKMIDCNDKKEIIDQAEDAVSQSVVTIEKDSLLVAETHYILNSNWEMDIVPARETTIKFVQGKPILSSKRDIFAAPPLAKEQQDSLATLNKNLKEKSKAGKIIYPYDEKSIYLLFMGAVNGNEEARYLLKNLDRLFILDGAIAETREEIWIEF
jgi:hypothetical protein